MPERYDIAAAAHYAAYRPPLHKLVLGKVLDANDRFHTGVDVGCGTGYSTVALAEYCDQTFGVDPSVSMLHQVLPHEQITYLHGAGDSLPVPTGAADIITFAGALYYADSSATRNELVRISHASTVVLIYDFQLQLAPVLNDLSIDFPEFESSYDHSANLSGHDEFEEQLVSRETITTTMSAREFAHVVLSDSYRLDHWTELHGRASAYDSLLKATGNGPVAVLANLYISSYVVKKQA